MKIPEKAIVSGLAISFFVGIASGWRQMIKQESRIIAIEKELDLRRELAIEHIKLVERVKALENAR